MDTSIENIDKLTAEEFLGPPKYDAIGLFMVALAGLIVGIVAGVMIVLLSYFIIGQFSIASGASSMLLALATFFSLFLGNVIMYFIRSRIFPHIYTRARTVYAQAFILSVFLYIFFVIVYMIVSKTSNNSMSSLLTVFSLHIVFNIFTFELLIGIISQYRYSLLSLYASTIMLLCTGTALFLFKNMLSDSTYTLFVLFGLMMMGYFLGGFFMTLLSWIYYSFYTSTGYDPIGSVFSQIEKEEKDIEKQAESILTKF